MRGGERDDEPTRVCLEVLCHLVCLLIQQSTASLFSLRSFESRTSKEDWRGDCSQHKDGAE